LILLYLRGVYPALNIERVLKEVFSEETSILEISHALAYRIKIGLPIITFYRTLLYIFINYISASTCAKDYSKSNNKTEF
ncbi:uncharacterized protein BDZ99DRAFT_388932, partial [Mytilinidion resinicola]